MNRLNEYQRARYARLRRENPGWPAAAALAKARAFDGKDYGSTGFRSLRPWGGSPSDSPRWCERYEDLRVAGFADEVTRGSERFVRNPIDHNGWYTSPDNMGEVYRGLVLQLPARDGKPRYLAAYADPDNEGAALVDTSTIHDVDTDAAMAADALAEQHAEREREYQSAWQAGSLYATLGEDIARERKALLAALGERRKVAASEVPTLCGMLRDKVGDVLDTIRESREKRAKLRDGEGVDWSPGFWTGDADLRDAFNDGAGEVVL